MNTLLAHNIFLFLHIIFVVIGFGAVVVVDTFGLLWLLKKIPLKSVTSTAEVSQKLIWTGWIGLVITGAALLYQRGSISDLGYLKLFFVAMLGINGLFLHFIKRSMEKLGSPENLPKSIMFRTSLASTISQTGWWGAFIIGFLNTNTSIPGQVHFNPLFVILPIILAICLVVLIAEAAFNKKPGPNLQQSTSNQV